MTCNVISLRFLRSTEYAEKTGINENGGKYTYEYAVKRWAELHIILLLKRQTSTQQFNICPKTMTCNTERAINHKEMVYIPEQHCTSKSHIYLISNVGIINLDITSQIKNMANKFVDSMATGVNYHKLVASVPESSLKLRKILSSLPWNT